MAVLDQPAKRAAHGNDVVVGMGREHKYPFWEYAGGRGAQRTRRSVTGALAPRIASARPAGDGVLHLVKADQIGLVGGAMHAKEILQAGLVIVVVGQLEHGFPPLLREPDDGP